MEQQQSRHQRLQKHVLQYSKVTFPKSLFGYLQGIYQEEADIFYVTEKGGTNYGQGLMVETSKFQKGVK